MKLTERKLLILRALIDDYIMTGVPVGSRTLSKHEGLGISSATIRNEMADLEEGGYLDQPHTSAGRTPSDKAYRLYVDSLMQISRLDPAEADKIRTYFDGKVNKITELVDVTAKALSDATKLVSVVMTPELSRMLIKRVQIVKLSEATAMLIIVFSTGNIRNTVIPADETLSAENYEMISNYISEAVHNKTLSEASDILDSLVGFDGMTSRRFVDGVMSAVSRYTDAQGTNSLVLGGAGNIFFHPEYQDINSAKNMLQLFETKDELYSMMKRATDMEFTIRIGNENELDQLKGMSVVTATYKVGGRKLGSFGVIGPTRMDYGKILSILSCVGGTMNSILENYIEGNDPK